MKKLSRSSYPEELRPYYFMGRILSILFTKKWCIKIVNALEKFLAGKTISGYDCQEVFISSRSEPGHKIRVRIFRPNQEKGNLPAMLYCHGGGYMIGNPEQYLSIYKRYLDTRPVVIIAPDYRKSLKHPFPAGFHDCYDTLLWAKENAENLRINATQFIVAGHSAGGGLTAAISLKARDTKEVKVAFQMPIYPMLDSRMITESAQNMKKAPLWSSANTSFAWSLYLRNLKEGNHYASVSSCDNYADLPPTASFVGTLEPFRDETIAYIEKLKSQGISVKFKLFEGGFHGFELVASRSSLAAAANDFQYGAYAEYYDQFFASDDPQQTHEKPY